MKLEDFASPRVVARGKRYALEGRVGSVTERWCLECGGPVLLGIVQGSRRKSYACEIHLHEEETLEVLEATCTCPMRYECKHAVALLHVWMTQRTTDEHGGGSKVSALPHHGIAAPGTLGQASEKPPTDTAVEAEPRWQEDAAFLAWCSELKRAVSHLDEAQHPPPLAKPGDEITRYRVEGVDVPNCTVAGFKRLVLLPERIRIRRDGTEGKPTPTSFESMASNGWGGPRSLSAVDTKIADLVLSAGSAFAVSEVFTEALRAAAKTGQLSYRATPTSEPIPIVAVSDEAVEGSLAWRTTETGTQLLDASVACDDSAPEARLPLLQRDRTWWLDRAAHTLHPVSFALPAPLFEQLLRIPPLSPEGAKAWDSGAIPKLLTDHLPKPVLLEERPNEAGAAPTPVLTLSARRSKTGERRPDSEVHAEANLSIRYGPKTIAINHRESAVRWVTGGVVEYTTRNRKAESGFVRTLEAVGLGRPWMASSGNVFVPAMDRQQRVGARPRLASGGRSDSAGGIWSLDQDAKDDSKAAFWLAFVAESVPALTEQGWEVAFDPAFPYRTLEAGNWVVEIHAPTQNEKRQGQARQGQARQGQAQQGWRDGDDFERDPSDGPLDIDLLGVDVGIEVGDVRVPAAPLLAEWLRMHGRDALARLEAHQKAGLDVFLPMPGGEQLRIAASRVWRMLHHLLGYFDRAVTGPFHLQKAQAASLVAELEDADQAVIAASEDFRPTVEGLKRLLGQRRSEKDGATPPRELGASLRPYQLAGMTWLETLHRSRLGGILADDMGLGKTVQLLAHLLKLKERNALTKPALVVAPTSVVGGWAKEAARFAPTLSVLVLAGPARKALAAHIPKAHLVLTSYALLRRDAKLHEAVAYSVLVLDEAQYVKNDQAATTRAVGKLTADQRLCLTGTPLENHLGELWSLMNFAVPGSLGSKSWFRTVFRTPIEKHGDSRRLAHLQRRIRPFILRRSKELVAKELPAKTEIVRECELSVKQRDIYETVRAALEKKVRNEIAALGLARSQIVVLDALLKLRQICCHPGLLTWHKPTEGIESAKFEDLKDLVTSLFQEGRRILIFSQFVKMLERIEAWLNVMRMPYAKLTGSTQARDKVIARFTNQEVPIFLISLKAGGTGLNLTEADTVIHYDPWWNPAVEAQATDRAHRIGQTKKVFVYRMITKGTVEQAIMALHKTKKGLSDAILEGTHKRLQLTASDIDTLFAPIVES